jgi:hypothetical protein
LEAVGLKSFLQKHPDAIRILFPTQEEATILGKELKARLVFEDEDLETNQLAKAMFIDYIDLLEKRQKGNFKILHFHCLNVIVWRRHGIRGWHSLTKCGV